MSVATTVNYKTLYVVHSSALSGSDATTTVNYRTLLFIPLHFICAYLKRVDWSVTTVNYNAMFISSLH